MIRSAYFGGACKYFIKSIMESVMKKSTGFIALIMSGVCTLSLYGCSGAASSSSDNTQITQSGEGMMNSSEDVTQETTTEIPTQTEPPTHAITGVGMINLYQRSGEQFYKTPEYESEWARGTDIIELGAFATDVSFIGHDIDQYYDGKWYNSWKTYEGWENCKLGYQVDFDLINGEHIHKVILSPADTESYFTYLENYLYDDINVAHDTWYSHMTEENMTDSTILSSIKFTPGENYSQIDGVIYATAFVYNDENDFDDNGDYIGNVSTTTVLYKTASKVALSIQSDGADYEQAIGITDASYSTMGFVGEGGTLDITASENVQGVYIVWGTPTQNVSVKAGEYEETFEDEVFLHQYISFETPVTSFSITCNSGANICDIYAYGVGRLPSTLQRWESLEGNADILVFSTHADDEILFLGGILATYGGNLGYDVQVAYMCNYWNGAMVREHEKLDGLWASGIKIYPINGNFDDIYAENLEQAMAVYSLYALEEFVTGTIRKYKPSVVVTQDINGEYGHGGHIILATAVMNSVNNSMNSSYYSDQADVYGTYDVPKTYFHLYPENEINLNLRIPLENMGDRTALEVASAAYLKHESQQWCWFYVSDGEDEDDDYAYSCARFGLYRTTVGADTGNDIMENMFN